MTVNSKSIVWKFRWYICAVLVTAVVVVAIVIPILIISENFGSSETITGHIYCDNWFQFYFNGDLVATDPMTFTPHQAVKVEFTWDGVSPKTYAILCQDFATSSGYEYTSSSRPQLGDGALIAEFSDGTVTNSSWTMFTESFGPTDQSIANGCSSSNLSPCELNVTSPPSDWFSPSFTEESGWSSATVYTASEAGWGRTPSWVEGKGCCTATSPITRSDLTLNDGCSVNYDPSAPTTGLAVGMGQDQCIDPRTIFENMSGAQFLFENMSGPQFLWGNDLKRDNKMLFRFTAN